MMYRLHPLWIACCVTAAALAAAPAARADLPPDQSVKLSIHSDPADLESAVAFVVVLDLGAVSQSENTVAWRIEAATFIQPDEGGAGDKYWTKTNPIVDTANGLWTIEHADASAPTLAEFLQPPLFSGTAASEDPDTADLVFSVERGQFVAGPSSAPSPLTSVLDYAFTLAGNSAPEVQGNDEPVEPIDPEDEPVEPEPFPHDPY